MNINFIMYALFIIYVFIGIFLAFFLHKLYATKQEFSTFISKEIINRSNSRKNVLLIIAHPDDESMFFIPTILQLRDHFNINMLCLSNGNFEGLGKIREVELRKVSDFLEIKNLKIIDHEALKDGMNEKWDPTLIKTIINEYFVEKPADFIITFDEIGVSSHPNHIAIALGARFLSRNIVLLFKFFLYIELF